MLLRDQSGGQQERTGSKKETHDFHFPLMVNTASHSAFLCFMLLMAQGIIPVKVFVRTRFDAVKIGQSPELYSASRCFYTCSGPVGLRPALAFFQYSANPETLLTFAA